MQKDSSQVQKQPYSLPRDIEVYEKKLLEVRNNIENLMRISDGLLFGKLGIDAIFGIIPGVGEIYTFFASCWMFVLAIRAKTPLKDMLTLIFLTILDISVGAVPAVGDIVDAFLRIHSWFGTALIETIDRKVSAISRAKVLASNGEYQDFNALKERLYS